jgi:hypothetical protein
MAEKRSYERRTSAAGIAVYPRVDGKPDTKFNKNGVWRVALALEGETADKFKAKIDEWVKASVEAAKENTDKKVIANDPPYKPEIDKDSEEETGRTLFSFKLDARVEPKKSDPFDQRPAILKADLTPFENSRVGGGSKLKIGYEVVYYAMPVTSGSDKGKVAAGVTLRLRIVQVLEYVAYTGSASPDSFKMEAAEGYTGDDSEPVTEDDDEDDDKDDEEKEEKTEPAKPAKGKTGKGKVEKDDF